MAAVEGAATVEAACGAAAGGCAGVGPGPGATARMRATGVRLRGGAAGGGAGAGTAAIGFGAGCRGKDGASASDEPQNLQNWEVASHAPRQRGQRRWDGSGGGVPTSITRAEATAGAPRAAGGGGAGPLAAAAAIASKSNFGGSGTVFDRSIAGPAGRPAAAGGGAATSSEPQVTQKRIPGWFALPQFGQALLPGTGTGRGASAGATAGAAGDSGRGPKLTAGAGGRGLRDGLAEGRAAPCGATAVAARGEVCAATGGGERPMGGVGGATRGASR